ncbi:dynamin family protein [Roseovarius aestuarii]|uniref:GTP-binding protein Der n=1 Tax=Roseovarius aestuarii TaxID=475083 RepID=A0A1X7BVT2_9RHOB|nr:dynamin family protein [Roseovarius aestuarii]SMC13747.1 GTP-binding protein Der [Roseovarius aestuarii]
MNVETSITGAAVADSGLPQQLLQASLGKLDAFCDSLRPLDKALRIAAKLGDEDTQKIANRLIAQLDKLEPSVTMIGQIKSGKTSLVNCMIGWPDLLPADVNPWTSVVTSLHLSPVELTPPTSAKFNFFEQDEWDRLVGGGGRIGELADRAGADDELEKIKAQVEQMREKSRARLGRKFEMLLGQEHDYGYFDQDLIERYVCLGDDFEDTEPDATSATQGRFADITRSADLFFHQPAIPMRLCIRDTPGVNDTFMMREQITIRSIRDSRICVVVLSAHQALSSTDLALIRLISNVKSRDVTIFVNRIDELSDPAKQVPQIRASIVETLAKHDGPADARIIFGSALWAQNAASGQLSSLPEASQEALFNWAEVAENLVADEENPSTILWHLSGVPALYETLAERITQGVGAEVTSQIVASTRNLINGMQLSDNLSAKAEVGETTIHLGTEEIATRLGALQNQTVEGLRQELISVQAAFDARIDRAHESFLERATEALISHLEKYGEQSIWEYSPSGLRMLLSSSYKLFGKKCQSAFSAQVGAAITELTELYHQSLQLPRDLFDIKAPPAPRVPPPVSLGQTIALDLKGGWWKSWWFRRRGFQAFATNFNELIKAETESIVADLKQDQAQAMREATLSCFQSFLSEQCAILQSATESASASPEKIDGIFGRSSLVEREKELREAHKQLDTYNK